MTVTNNKSFAKIPIDNNKKLTNNTNSVQNQTLHSDLWCSTMAYRQECWILQKVPIYAPDFALEQHNPLSGSDLSIFSIYDKAIKNRFSDHQKMIDNSPHHDNPYNYKEIKYLTKIVDRLAIDLRWITESWEVNIWMNRQSGTFLFSDNSEEGNQVITIFLHT